AEVPLRGEPLRGARDRADARERAVRETGTGHRVGPGIRRAPAYRAGALVLSGGVGRRMSVLACANVCLAAAGYAVRRANRAPSFAPTPSAQMDAASLEHDRPGPEQHPRARAHAPGLGSMQEVLRVPAGLRGVFVRRPAGLAVHL